jgi:hypothetical protein
MPRFGTPGRPSSAMFPSMLPKGKSVPHTVDSVISSVTMARQGEKAHSELDDVVIQLVAVI